MKAVFKFLSLNVIRSILVSPIITQSSNKIKSLKKKAYAKTFGAFFIVFGVLLIFTTFIITSLELVVPKLQALYNLSQFESTIIVLVFLSIVSFLIGYIILRGEYIKKIFYQEKPPKVINKSLLTVALSPFIDQFSKERNRNTKKETTQADLGENLYPTP